MTNANFSRRKLFVLDIFQLLIVVICVASTSKREYVSATLNRSKVFPMIFSLALKHTTFEDIRNSLPNRQVGKRSLPKEIFIFVINRRPIQFEARFKGKRADHMT